MKSPSSCDSTSSSSDENFAHNIRNSFLELLFHVQIGGTFEPFVDETDLARIALSYHFALVQSVTKKVLTLPHDALAGTIARCESPLWFGTVATPCAIDVRKCKAGIITWVFICLGKILVFSCLSGTGPYTHIDEVCQRA